MDMLKYLRAPAWIINALNAQEGGAGVPTVLDNRYTRPVLDIGQGGWGNAEWIHRRIQQPAATAGVTEEIEATAQFDRQFLVVGLSMERVVAAAGVAGGRVALIAVGQNSVVPGYIITDFVVTGVADVPPVERRDTADFLSGIFPTIVPPGYGINLLVPTTQAGESYDINIAYARIRSGYKPL